MKLSSLSDQELISLYLENHPTAFEVLLKRHKNMLFRAIYLKVKDEALANDIFQDTFFKIVKQFQSGNYNDEGKFYPWALRIANNLIIDYFRKKQRTRLINEKPSKHADFSIFDMIAHEDDDVLKVMSKEELYEQIVSLIEYLPENQQEMIRMRFFEDYAFKDIAETLDISINTALGRMRYAIINLRKLIEENNLSIAI